MQLSSIYISPDQSTLSLAESSGNVSNEASKPCIADGVFKSVSKDVVDGEAKVLDTDSKINDTTAVSDHVAASNVKRSILEYLASAKVLPSTFHTLACEDSNNASVGEVDKPLPAENNVSSTTTSPSQPKAEAPLPDQSRKRTAALVLEVESEMALCRRLFRSAKELRVESALLHDERWRLVSAFQCSFVGQLQKYLEHLAVLNSCNPNIHPDSSVHTSANAWEAILRNSCGSQSCWRTESSLPQHRVPPIIIRSREKSFDLSSRVVRFVEMARSSIGFYSSHISSKEQAIDAISSCGSGNDSLVSDWTLFSVFIEEACEQVD